MHIIDIKQTLLWKVVRVQYWGGFWESKELSMGARNGHGGW